jgi:hypothetical protein
MPRRTARKSTARKRNATAFVSRIGWLPGALFLGAVFREERWQFSITRQHEENVDLAERLQDIRADHEMDGFEEMLWANCLEMGFDSTDIRGFMMNSGLITSCGYMPIPLR